MGCVADALLEHRTLDGREIRTQELAACVTVALVIEGFIEVLLGDAGLARHRPDQVLAERRLRTIDRDLVPMPAHVLDPLLV